jgi:hypothetical protein
MKKVFSDEYFAEFRGAKFIESGVVKIIDGTPFFSDSGRLWGSRPITNRVIEAVFYESYIRKDHTGDTGKEVRVFHFGTDGVDGGLKFGKEIESRIKNLLHERNHYKLLVAQLQEKSMGAAREEKLRSYMKDLFEFVKDVKDKIFIAPTGDENEQGRRPE